LPTDAIEDRLNSEILRFAQDDGLWWSRGAWLHGAWLRLIRVASDTLCEIPKWFLPVVISDSQVAYVGLMDF
jgi:hypothetical protein